MYLKMQNKKWKAVPKFGAWEQKGNTSPNYSVVFGQARAHRKQVKNDVRRLSLGDESELILQHNPRYDYDHHHKDADSVMVRLNFHSYINY